MMNALMLLTCIASTILSLIIIKEPQEEANQVDYLERVKNNFVVYNKIYNNQA